MSTILTKTYPSTTTQTEIAITVIRYSNALMFIVTNCDQLGTIVKIERQGGFEGKSSFDVSVAHGYSDESEEFESLAGLFAEALFKRKGLDIGSVDPLSGLNLVFMSFCFPKECTKNQGFTQEVAQVLKQFALEIKPKQNQMQPPIDDL